MLLVYGLRVSISESNIQQSKASALTDEDVRDGALTGLLGQVFLNLAPLVQLIKPENTVRTRVITSKGAYTHSIILVWTSGNFEVRSDFARLQYGQYDLEKIVILFSEMAFWKDAS